MAAVRFIMELHYRLYDSAEGEAQQGSDVGATGAQGGNSGRDDGGGNWVTSGARNIKCVAAHPGVATTAIASNSTASGMYCITRSANAVVMALSSQAEEDGALPYLCALLSPDTQSGDMWAPANSGFWPQCYGRPLRYPIRGSTFEPQSLWEPAVTRRCWDLTEVLLLLSRYDAGAGGAGAAGATTTTTTTTMGPGNALARGASESGSKGIARALRGEAGQEAAVVFVLGGPGAGKGTACQRITDAFGNYVHLSAGDLLRAERASGSELGETIEGHFRAGSLVPADLTVRLLRQAMEQSGESKFLVDGFPRNADNLLIWERDMQHCVVDFVLMLDCSEAAMEQRLIRRGQTSGRSDDNIEAIRKRFKTFKESTVPIIQQYEREGKLCRVNSDRDAEAVFADVRDIFNSVLEGK